MFLFIIMGGLMRYGVFITVLLTLILLIACAPPRTVTVPESQPTRTTVPKTIVSEPAPDSEPEQLDPAIAALITKGQKAENYYYRFDAHDRAGYKLWIKGTLLKKVYFNSVKLQRDVNYDTVYLDIEKKTAIAACMTAGVSCNPVWGKYFTVDFAKEKPVPTPIELLEQIPATAVKVGSENYDNRAATIIEYTTAAGKIIKMSLDTFYGLPLKQEEYTLLGDERTLQEKHTFTQISVGNVKTAEVTLPANYQLFELS